MKGYIAMIIKFDKSKSIDDREQFENCVSLIVEKAFEIAADENSEEVRMNHFIMASETFLHHQDASIRKFACNYYIEMRKLQSEGCDMGIKRIWSSDPDDMQENS